MDIYNKIKERIPAKLWYKYFFKPETTDGESFTSVNFPIVNRKFT